MSNSQQQACFVPMIGGHWVVAIRVLVILATLCTKLIVILLHIGVLCLLVHINKSACACSACHDRLGERKECLSSIRD